MRNRTTAAAGGLVLLGSLAVSGAVPAQAVSGGDYVPSVARATHVFPAFAGGMRSIDRGVSQIIPAGHRCVDEMATTPNQRSAWTGSYAVKQEAPSPVLLPSVAIRRYASAAQAQAAFRVIKRAYQRCYGDHLVSPGWPDTIAFRRFDVPKIGPQTFGVTVWASYMDDPSEPSMVSSEKSLVWVSSGATIAVAEVSGGTARSRAASAIEWAKTTYRVVRLR